MFFLVVNIFFVLKKFYFRGPHPQNAEIESKEEEEEQVDVATNLGGVEPLTGHFTMTNASSDEDN